jgi:hypothetical protein
MRIADVGFGEDATAASLNPNSEIRYPAIRIPAGSPFGLEDLLPEGRVDQLHSKMGRLVLHIEDRINLRDLE